MGTHSNGTCNEKQFSAMEKNVFKVVAHFVVSLLISASATETSSERQLHSSAACVEGECSQLQLTCSRNERILLDSQNYGYLKGIECMSNGTKCIDDINHNTLCSSCISLDYACTDLYSTEHAYNIYKECSGRSACVPAAVEGRMQCLQSEENKIDINMNVFVKYHCIPESDVVQLCTEGSITGSDIYVLYDSYSAASLPRTSTCRCSVLNPSNRSVVVLEDIRLEKSGQDDVCSSSVLEIGEHSYRCNSSRSAQENFMYRENVELLDSDITLRHVNEGDKPSMIWLRLAVHDSSSISVRCKKANTEDDEARPSLHDGSLVAVVVPLAAVIIFLIVALSLTIGILLKRNRCNPESKDHGNAHSNGGYTHDEDLIVGPGNNVRQRAANDPTPGLSYDYATIEIVPPTLDANNTGVRVLLPGQSIDVLPEATPNKASADDNYAVLNLREKAIVFNSSYSRLQCHDNQPPEVSELERETAASEYHTPGRAVEALTQNNQVNLVIQPDTIVSGNSGNSITNNYYILQKIEDTAENTAD